MEVCVLSNQVTMVCSQVSNGQDRCWPAYTSYHVTCFISLFLYNVEKISIIHSVGMVCELTHISPPIGPMMKRSGQLALSNHFCRQLNSFWFMCFLAYVHLWFDPFMIVHFKYHKKITALKKGRSQSFLLLSSHHYDFLRTKGPKKDQYNIGTHYRYDKHVASTQRKQER